ncbi:D-amino-acid transaminase [Minwuia thermotolerans]|uniref:Probable branched-chain-amino-acid aminotransferase n=1 Tax=Minwuia thermotolerans TaxID=2056226 RepID=A0A2M9FYW5_9PROT|nr:D-amino-acid transaminase [Minwuia thermotolerans]PJK28655.1 D-amino acid aminotransferase [Minwuia thermotolerans]
MTRIAFVNGQYVPHQSAAVHVEDRGYQFSDGVYEVIPIVDGRQIDGVGHVERLARSLRELRIDRPMSDRALNLVIEEVVRRNRVRDGFVYIQVTRGVAARDHGFPRDAQPAVVIYARPKAADARRKAAAEGVAVITVPDQRWTRRDIKTVSLLPNCLAKQSAREAGAYEAFMVDGDGMITEGSSTNAWIVDQSGRLVTRPASSDILNGITRLALMKLARETDIEIEERPFSVEELKTAREVFLTSASGMALPVVRVDDREIGNGRPGSVSSRVVDMFERYVAGSDTEAAAGMTVA